MNCVIPGKIYYMTGDLLPIVINKWIPRPAASGQG